jgi:hypothetical protein
MVHMCYVFGVLSVMCVNDVVPFLLRRGEANSLQTPIAFQHLAPGAQPNSLQTAIVFRRRVSGLQRVEPNYILTTLAFWASGQKRLNPAPSRLPRLLGGMLQLDDTSLLMPVASPLPSTSPTRRIKQ